MEPALHHTQPIDPADFVAAFADYWSKPSAERLSALLHDDVVLRQPLSASVHGIAAARAWTRKLLRLIPDLHAVVDDWSARDRSLFIQFHLIGTVSGTRIEWSAVDRFELDAGRARERVSYFDSVPLVRALLRRPWTWPRAARFFV